MESEHFNSRWPTPLRYFAAILLLLGILGVIVFIKPVFDTVALGFIFAFLFYGPISWVSRRFKNKYGVALGLFYLLVFAGLIILIIGGARYFSDSLQSLYQNMTPAVDQLQSPVSLPNILTSGFVNFATWFSQVLASFISNFAGLIGLVFVGLFFSALLLLNLHQARNALSKWIPEAELYNVQRILINLDQVWVGYMTAQVIYGAVLAAGSWVEYALLGVPYAFLMAVLTGVISLIPTIGGLVASLIVAIPCVLFGSTRFTEMSPIAFAVLVTALNILITQVSYNFVALPVVGKFVRLPVSVVLIMVLAGVAMGNILLAFLVVPLLSTLTIIGSYLLSKVAGRDPFPGVAAEAQSNAGFFSQILTKEPSTTPAMIEQDASYVK